MSNERSSWLWRDPGEAQRSREGGQESRRGAGAGPGGGAAHVLLVKIRTFISYQVPAEGRKTRVV